MNCFLVISGDLTQSAIEKNYPEFNYEVKEGIWIVADGEHTVSGTIYDKLELGGADERNRQEDIEGFVVRIPSDYFGFYEKGIWSVLSTWRKL